MSRYHSYLNSAVQIVNQYNGNEPFVSFLKKHFSADKKYGSKDRKQISHLCYCYFRIGKMKMEWPVNERILAGLFLCSSQSNEVLQQLKPEWNPEVASAVKQKLSFLSATGNTNDIFQFTNELSGDIAKEEFILSHLKQPDFFLRLRPGKEKSVKDKLKNAGIDFEIISKECIALPNSSKADSVIEFNRDAVVQDYSSQRMGEFFTLVRPGRSDKVWDCCAGSGGKSILLKDLYPGVDLTVSDIRESILVNLKKRFKEAGITKYKSTVTDLTGSDFKSWVSGFDLIIADVPCTGSGTWSRTPEQLYYFMEEKMEEYASLQKKIASNVIPHLQPGGSLLYITCSVFKKENENIVEFIKQNFHLQLIKIEVLKGYDKKADTMFAALLKKPL